MGEVDVEEYVEFLASHRPQLVSSGVPEHLYQSLFAKITSQTLDAGDYFMCVREEGDNDEVQWSVQLTAEDGLKHDDPNAIFLIDHAWTFRWNNAREQLEENGQLLERMMHITMVDSAANEDKPLTTEQQAEMARKPSIVLLNHNTYDPVDKVLKSLWKYANTYSVRAPNADVETTMPVWYIMDEFGCRVGHSHEPNVRIIPFLHVPSGMFYSIMFPVRDLQCNDEISRHYAEVCRDKAHLLDYHLLPWFDKDFSQKDDSHAKADEDFMKKYREMDNMPQNGTIASKELGVKSNISVYSDSEQLVKNIRNANIALTSDPNTADVWWLMAHFKDFGTFSLEHPNAMINQFPSESCLTVKDMLAIVVQTVYSKDNEVQYPNWFKVTYNLQTELPQFVAHFQKREKNGDDNTWIIKPWNLARGLDTYVTDNLAQIIRLVESGPKIACKYIDNPVVFYRDDLTVNVKFDLRYIVLLKSIEPLQVYVYDRFWIRFGRKAFCLDYFDDYDRHFTVFNYTNPEGILQMNCEDFVTNFEAQNKNVSWKNAVQPKINKAIKELFQTVCKLPPPMGLGKNTQSRAMYGLDLMLQWNMQTDVPEIEPVILEVNFMPDCQRACQYYQDFADSVFGTLFLPDPDTEKMHVTRL